MRKIALFIIILTTSLSVFSQVKTTGEIRGFVYDTETGEPIIFTNVYFEGKAIGAATDVNGFYSITKVPPGDYTLISTYLGYDTLRQTITIVANKIQTLNLKLNKSSIDLGEVQVSASKYESTTEVQVSVTKITALDIKRIPTVGGEPDLAQYLQTLPGVIFTGDQGGQLYIRGGSPIQNMVLLDGMVVYNPFHSIGLFSIFETDIIRNVDVYSGGFNAEYGGRISAVMDVTTRDGNKKRFGGKVGVSPFTSKIILEGPIKPLGESGNSISYILTGRTSYLEQTAKPIYGYDETIAQTGLPYNFNDVYGKLSINGASGSKVNLFGFRHNDRVNFGSPADFGWDALGFGTNFLVIPAASSVLINGNFAYSSYESFLQEEGARNPRRSLVDGFNLGLDFTYFLGGDELKYGIEMLGFQTDFEFYNAFNQQIKQQEFTTELAGFFKYKITGIENLILEPSVRAHYYASLSDLSFEPRLGAKYLLTNKLRVKFAGGFYSQNLMSATSDRDVVNLFYGFLSSPDNLPREYNGELVESSLQKSTHAVGGLEIDLSNRLTANIEPYIKSFNQLTNINRNKIFQDNPDNADVPDIEKKDFIIETGAAKGIDLSLKYDYKRLFYNISYSYGKVNRFYDTENGLVEYFPHFDRRHNVNLVGSYTFGAKLDWEFNGRFNFGTGFPFTQTAGFFEKLTFNDGINSNYTSTNGDLTVIYSDLNGGRLPTFHRLDLSLKKSIQPTENSSLDIILSVTNVYNRENIFYFDRIKYKQVNQLPILPSIGISYAF